MLINKSLSYCQFILKTGIVVAFFAGILWINTSQVYAQGSCGGTIYCTAFNGWACSCSIGSGSCSTQGQACGPFGVGTCGCTPQCGGGGSTSTIFCGPAYGNNQSGCESAGCSGPCGSGGGSCSWTPNASTNTPPPTNTPGSVATPTPTPTNAPTIPPLRCENPYTCETAGNQGPGCTPVSNLFCDNSKTCYNCSALPPPACGPGSFCTANIGDRIVNGIPVSGCAALDPQRQTCLQSGTCTEQGLADANCEARQWANGPSEITEPGRIWNAFCCGQIIAPTPTPTSTLTPIPPCTIQGFKIMMPGNQVRTPASTQTITLDSTTTTNAEPYFFSNIPAGTHHIHTTLPAANFTSGYTLCINGTTCHNGIPTKGVDAFFTCPAGGYADLWWHYYEVKGWYKLSNASLHKNGSIFNYFPAPVEKFDNDDTLDPYLIVNNAGVITANGPIEYGINSAKSSANNWERPAYTKQSNLLSDISSYVKYVKARKKFKIITNLTQIERDTINILSAETVTINSPSQINVDNAVLIVEGNITIGPLPGNKLNASGRSIALMATGTINIHSSVTDINAILIANSIDIASELSSPNKSPNTLKVNGNLISNTVINAPLERERANHLQPSLFVIFNPQMYLDLIPYLSTITREGREIQ